MRRTVWNGAKDVPVHAYDVDYLSCSDKSLAGMMRALVRHHGWWTSSYLFGREPTGRNTVVLRVFVPEGAEPAVEAEAGVKLKRPGALMLNDSRDRIVTCRACGRRENVRLEEDDVYLPKAERPAPPDWCSEFCHGRLVERDAKAVPS